MDYVNCGKLITNEEVYTPQENPSDLFDRLASSKKIKLEPRPMFIKVGTVSNVKGSAYMEYGNTKVLAQVEPPKEISKQAKKNYNLGEIVCTVKYAVFALSDVNDVKEKENYMGIALRKALEPVVCRHEFSNFQLEIQVLILDDDGCALSTAITCCGVALIEGGIPTFDLVTASTVCVLKGVEYANPDAEIEDLLYSLPHLNAENEVEEHGIVTVSSLALIGQISQCFQKGYLTPTTVERLFEYSANINKQMIDTVRHVLVDKIKQHIAKKQVTAVTQ